MAEVIRNLGATVFLHVLKKQEVGAFWPHFMGVSAELQWGKNCFAAVETPD